MGPSRDLRNYLLTIVGLDVIVGHFFCIFDLWQIRHLSNLKSVFFYNIYFYSRVENQGTVRQFQLNPDFNKDRVFTGEIVRYNSHKNQRPPFDTKNPYWLKKEFAGDTHRIPVMIDGYDGDNLLVHYIYPQHAKQVPCTSYEAGNCRYGDSCRYSHGVIVQKSDLDDHSIQPPDVGLICLVPHKKVNKHMHYEMARIDAVIGDNILLRGRDVHFLCKILFDYHDYEYFSMW